MGGREWNVGEGRRRGLKSGYFWREGRVVEVPIVSDISPRTQYKPSQTQRKKGTPS